MSEPSSAWGELRKAPPNDRPIVFNFLPDEEVIYVDDDHMEEWERLLAERCGVVLTPDLRKRGTGSGTIGSCSVGLDYSDMD
jgi:hypothetical protein